MLALAVAGAGGCGDLVEDTIWEDAQDSLRYSDKRADPDFLQRELQSRPGNRTLQEMLVGHYARRDRGSSRLPDLLLRLVESHPNETSISLLTSEVFYEQPELRAEVVAALRRKVHEVPPSSDLHWNLASILAQAALPPAYADGTAMETDRVVEWYGLASTDGVPLETDWAVAAEAEEHYRAALEVAGETPQWRGAMSSSYARGLARLLIGLGLPDEARWVLADTIEIAEPMFRGDLELQLAELHVDQGELAEAETLARAAIHDDCEWYQKGHVTTEAYTLLGDLALERGRVDEAERMLLASATVALPCPHTRSLGMPYALADALVERGRLEVPARYYRLVLEEFTPGRAEVQQRLARIAELQAAQECP